MPAAPARFDDAEPAGAPPSRTARARPSRWAESIAAAVPAAILIVGAGTFGTVAKLLLVLLAGLLALNLVRRELREPGSPVPIAWCTGALLAIAVIVPPQFSYDLWVYAMVGRIVAVHHASPFLHAPDAFRNDHFVNLVGYKWRQVTTPYGPLFALHAAGIALISGSHPLLYRLLFQGSAALAIGGALRAVWRATGSTGALALLGLHPLIACSLVNGGHNDAIVGLGILLAVINARKERYGRAGAWVTVALLVKVTAGLALLPLLGWAWTRGRRRAVGRVATAPLLVALPAITLIPGVARSLFAARANGISRSSIWNGAIGLLHFMTRVQRPGALLVTVALAFVFAVAAAAAWFGRRTRDPAPGVVASITAWLIFGSYVLPWYSIWALPTAALRIRDRLTWVVALQGLAMTAVYLVPRTSLGGGGIDGGIVHIAVPAVLLAMFVWAMLPTFGRGGAAEPREPLTANVALRALPRP